MKAELTFALITHDEKGRMLIGPLGEGGFPRDSFIRQVIFDKGIPDAALVQVFINGEPQLMPVDGVPFYVVKHLFGYGFDKTSLTPLMPGDYVEVDIYPKRKKFKSPPRVGIVVEQRPEWKGPTFFVPLAGAARRPEKKGYRQ